LLHHSPVITPIPGTSKVAHLEDNVAGAALKLEPTELETIDQLHR
jgi:aryl-alcohol dehydrogenase-like predicted oxidoreductase